MKIARLATTFLATCVVAGALASAPASTHAAMVQHGIEPTSYFYGLNWHPRSRVLNGFGQIALNNYGADPVSHVWLRLRANSGDALARVSKFEGARIVDRLDDGSMVKLRLNHPDWEETEIEFRYRLKVPRANSSLGHSAGMDLFGDALPVVAVEGKDGIRVGPEPLFGEGSLNPVADWDVTVNVPRGLRLVGPGARFYRSLRTRRVAQYNAGFSGRDIAFAIGQFRTVSQKVGRTKISVAGSVEMRSELRPALRRAVHAFRTMQRWYGGYESRAFKVVLGDLPFGGSEFSGIVFSTPDNATIAHEVAHQWFYGLVGSDQYNDPFLDESLTAFSEQRFQKSYRCDLARPIRGGHGLGTGMSYWEKHPKEYEHTIYRGGACALTVLQHDLGEDVFDRALRAYVAANSNKIAGVDDFLTAIRNAAPWYDLARWQRLVGLD